MRRRNERRGRGAVPNDMIGSHPRLNAAHAEQLLAGPQPEAEDPLSRVLAAAAAPARAKELAGEDDAVRAFHLARRASPVPPLPVVHRRRPRYRWGWALVVKVAAIVLATATASWALAATTGVVPAPWQPSPVKPPPASATGPGGSHRPTPTAPASATADPAGTPGATPMGSIPPAADPSLHARCRSFVNQGGSLDLLDNPSLSRLAVAAGGKQNVPAYCEALLAQDPSGTAGLTVTPSPTGS